MRRIASHAWQLLAGTLLTFGASSAAWADDSEIFIQKEITGGAANLLLILDTSGSMHNVAVSTTSEVVQPYNSALRYGDHSAGCQDDSIYYRADDPLNTTPPTSCAGLTRLELDLGDCTNNNCNQCQAASDLRWGSSWVGGRTGSYRDFFIRWRGTSSTNRTWSPNLETGSGTSSGRDLECRADAGRHGNGGSDEYPRSGPDNNTSSRWGASNRSWWSISGNTGTEVVLWSPNRIRYEGHPATTVTSDLSRMEVVKQAAVALLDSPNLNGMNVGLMRYSSNAEGGMILWPVTPLTDESRTEMKNLINGIVEAGNTPLSETLYEAHQYFAGREVDYGDSSRICVDNDRPDNAGGNAQCEDSDPYYSHPASIVSGSNPARYISPADAACQNNYIVFLTDGMPTSDSARDRIEALDQWDELELQCDDSRDASAGQCLVALSAYLNRADLRDEADVEGRQFIRTFFIGFGDDFAGNLEGGPFQYLVDAATAGGGEAFQAGDLPQLEGAFNSILASVTDTNTTFSAPTVAVNAFNRTQTLNDLYVAVFQPSTGRHWPGNLKKYKLVDGQIFDRNDRAAVNPNDGFFDEDAQSFWSTTRDGFNVTAGGAANLIPDPADRTVYTYKGDNTPGAAVSLAGAHEFVADYFTDTDFAIGNPGDPTLADLVAWAIGQDVRDLDPKNSNAEEARHVMGDPMHTQPAVVIYSGSEEDPEAVVFLPTNDGYLHAIDTETGVELWSFIPQEVLPQLKHLYANENIDTKQYLLDGEVRVLKFDVDGDGVVESGDRVFIYFSQGRGGQHYYALEVTDKDSPKFMWSLGPSELTGVGQTWSPPAIIRVNIGDGSDQNSQKLALVFAGGYDPAEESEEFVASDSQGNRLYIVDALKGNVLWSAGPESSGANLELARMTHSIPSRVSTLDTNQDGYVDRMYVGDMGGQLWRFDLFNSTATTEVEAADFARGGIIASLGGKAPEASVTLDARRFFNAPDVAALQTDRDPPYLNITIGSGHRGRPLSEATDDRLYSIRDYIPFRAMTEDEYESFDADPILDGDLQDITETVNPTIAADSPGWRLRLSTGEKVLSESTTFNGNVFFVTYTGSMDTPSDTCVANSSGTGSNSAYIVSAKNGAPVEDLRDTSVPDGGETDPDGDGDLTVEDRSVDLQQGGIASGVTFLFPEPNKLVCLSGVEVLGVCTSFKSRVKTYWREAGGI